MPEESRLSLKSVDVLSVGEEISLSRGGIALYLSSSASTPVHTTFPSFQSIVRYPSTDVGVGRLDDSGVGTP